MTPNNNSAKQTIAIFETALDGKCLPNTRIIERIESIAERMHPDLNPMELFPTRKNQPLVRMVKANRR
jgi:hypothetical protein